MAIRDILLGADPETGEGGVGVFRGTKLNDEPKYESDLIKCFDENVIGDLRLSPLPPLLMRESGDSLFTSSWF